MTPSKDFYRIVNGKRYSVATSMHVAGDDYWDGSNFERRGRNTHLYKSGKGQFFLVHMTLWQGENDFIELVTPSEARDYYEQFPEKYAEYAEAFGVEPEEG